MQVVALISWPCPVDPRMLGAIIVTEESVHHIPRLDPKVASSLANGTDPPGRESTLPQSRWSLRRSEITGASLLEGRARIRLMAANREETIDLGTRNREPARALFQDLVQHMRLDTHPEPRVLKWETFRDPILVLLFVLLAGSYLWVLSRQDLPRDLTQESWLIRWPEHLAGAAGATGVGIATATALVAILAWSVHRLRNPVLIRSATRSARQPTAGTRPRSIDEAGLRARAARLLNIDPERLTPEANFREDLRIPPGELLDALAELGTRYQVDLPADEVHTFGDLLESLR